MDAIARTDFVVVADNRKLTYDDIGDRDGDPVVYLHGCPDCRLTRPPRADVEGARIIAVDRPGYGASDADRNGTADTLASDLERLADALGLERFAVYGWSAGAAGALATAARLGDRVAAVGLAAPQLPRGDATLVVPFPLDEELALEFMVEGKDAAYVRDLESVDGLHEQMARATVAAVANGLDGVEVDLRAELPSQVVDAPVLVWYGGDDPAEPVDIPNATVRVIERASHLVAIVRWNELVTELLSAGWGR